MTGSGKNPDLEGWKASEVGRESKMVRARFGK